MFSNLYFDYILNVNITEPENSTSHFAVSQMNFCLDFSEWLAQWKVSYSSSSIVLVILIVHALIWVLIHIVWNAKKH